MPRQHDQMDVIGDQAPIPDLDIGGPPRAAEEIAIEQLVLGIKERLLPAVATLGDMVPNVGNDDPGETGHAWPLASRCAEVN